ncbi:hypothetical protein XELAEV_18002406mg [Xenopus laevis]|nr:hypothetical protein XELAEV_18002406mg [Xenopus laevis]
MQVNWGRLKLLSACAWDKMHACTLPCMQWFLHFTDGFSECSVSYLSVEPFFLTPLCWAGGGVHKRLCLSPLSLVVQQRCKLPV